MAPNEAIMAADDSAFALAFGLLTPAEAALRGAARMTECFDRYLLLELGQALCMTGQPEAAARVLGALAHRFAQVDPSGRVAAAREAHASVCADPRARHFERELFTHWATTACRIDPSGSADEPVWSLAVRRGLWRSRLQRPMDHYDRSLSKRPFWEASTLPAARALEAAFPHILTECEALLQRRDERFAKYHSRVVQTGDWSDMQLFAGCKRDAAHCALCPRTAAVIEGQPRLNGVIYGSHFFSRLAPGTHLSRHCGPSNFRLRCHLGLVVPEGLRIRVGSEVRQWEAGKCLVFDDSFEHEVWHDGTSDRVVLICDLWHPELDVDATVVPMLNERQLDALNHARAGRHLLMTERTYSTGSTVTRGD